jgi:hypothetical protein
MNMKRLGTLLAGVGLIVASGAIDTVRADDYRVALYTPAIHSGSFNCNALNVSHKTLNITISIIDLDGHPLSVSPPTPTAPGVEFSNDFGTVANPIDAYCKFEAFPTGDRSDLRVVLVASLVRTFAEGDQTNIPAFVARTVEGY